MTCYQEASYPKCNSIKTPKSGANSDGKQRYYCRNPECKTKAFMLDYSDKACAYVMTGGAYERYIEPNNHEVGKRNTQIIERNNLNLRTWVKRLTRKQFVFQSQKNACY